ncbi:TraB/GumN family protein [Sphingomonas sp. 28-63-12]|uniref:TraB/GumN family protein n=1 Tax=Sphingomonas sp. 28-63-12 TaxID=1970434 RepID=UPI000BD0B800|nr:MAG: hypothetical protein B7Y47_03435 [Sphingomonas sp. 28-63-12]
MRWRLIAPLLIAALVALPGCSRPRPAPARPALFVVRDADTVIWLFGTIHALPANIAWETPAVRRAIQSSQMLVTEIARPDSAAISALFLKLARRDGLPPIIARVPANDRAALDHAIASAAESATALNELETWAAAVTLESSRARAAGATTADGVETVLAARFAGKPQRALESAASQLGLFDALSEQDQRRLLARTVEDGGGYPAALAAWSTGDVAAMAHSNAQLFAGAPELEVALLTGRNARWSRWIAGRMRQPGTIMVAVGAGHLVGPKSVVAMLRARGLKVSRIQ